MKLSFRKLSHLIIYYLVPVLLSYLALNVSDPHEYAEFGLYTISLLIIILYAKPLAVISKLKFLWKIVSYRRELGILSFWTFAFHSLGLVYSYSLYDISNWFTAVYWGVSAGIGLFIVVSTSNDIAVKLLKRNWKRIQNLSYIVLPLALVHVSLIKSEYMLYIALFVVFAILKLLEWRKFKKVQSSNDNQKM